jgi:hypothetical protein
MWSFSLNNDEWINLNTRKFPRIKLRGINY